MNKILIAALLVGMSGTAFGTLHAQQTGASSFTEQQKQNLPPELTSILKDIQAAPAANVLPADYAKYISDLQTQIKQFTAQLTAFNKTKGYDPVVGYTIQTADAQLDRMNAKIQRMNTDVQEPRSSLKCNTG